MSGGNGRTFRTAIQVVDGEGEIVAVFEGFTAQDQVTEAIQFGHVVVGREDVEYGGDKLDDGEKFDQLEMDRVFAQDPDSLAFFQAQKKMRQNVHSTSPTHKASRRTRR